MDLPANPAAIIEGLVESADPEELGELMIRIHA